MRESDVTGQQFTIGVLGHVDHGKTSLVKALTGTETDRLKEERRRGMSIVLGFAYLECDQGVIDFIDVPGHENFVRTMISGATGIDAVLLVVAANEGIKPQTHEHLAIAQLLGIKQGLVVVSKSDLADDNSLAAAREQIAATVRGTFLEDSPVHTVSADSGKGIGELSQALANMITSKPPGVSGDTFCLPMDRVFTVDGFGTVGTGTLRNGAIRCDDEVEILPSALKASVREIQVHNQQVTEALPGQRVAVNLRGISREQLQRGHILTRPGSIQKTTCLYAKLQVLDDLSRLPKRNELIRLLFGTTNVLAKIRVIDNSPLESGASLLVQLRCRETVFVSAGEHFIARTCSPVFTFGGGEFLDTSEQLAQMSREALVNHLRKLENADIEGKVVAYLQASGTQGISLARLAEKAHASESQTRTVLEKSGAVIINDTIAVHHSSFDDLCERTILALADFHKKEPSAGGQSLELFRKQCLESCSAEIAEYLMKYLSDSKKTDVAGNCIRLSGFNRDNSIGSSERDLIDAIEQVFRDNGTATPPLEEIVGDDPARKRAYRYLEESGKLISLEGSSGANSIVFHLDTIEGIKKQLAEAYPPPHQFTVSEFRVLADSSRKYVIPILEYFDRNRITIRDGNHRVLTRVSNNFRR